MKIMADALRLIDDDENYTFLDFCKVCFFLIFFFKLEKYKIFCIKKIINCLITKITLPNSTTKFLCLTYKKINTNKVFKKNVYLNNLGIFIGWK